MENPNPQPAQTPGMQPSAPAPGISGPVMDIQPPRPVSPTSQIQDQQLAAAADQQPVAGGGTAAVSPESAPAPTSAEPRQWSAPAAPVASASVAPAPAGPVMSGPDDPTAMPVSPAPAPTDATGSGVVSSVAQGQGSAEPAPAATDSNATNAMAIPTKPMKPHRRLPMGALIAAVVVGVLLVALAVLAYVKQGNKTGSSSNNTSQTTAQPLTANDVDASMNEVEKSLSDLNDTNDFAANDLADTALDL